MDKPLECSGEFATIQEVQAMKRAFPIVAILLLLLPITALGQAERSGSVRGTVVNDEGQPIEGATITVTNLETAIEREATSDAQGQYQFRVLPPGAYTVLVTAPGRQPQVLEFNLGIGETVPLKVELRPGEVVAETITVYGTATNMETTTTGENMDYDTEVSELPIGNRDIQNVATFSPNISFGPTPGTLAISGAPSFDTVVLLDGAEISDPLFGSAPTLWLEDAIEEVQVLTAGVSARYGRFQGGVINAITKTGGNEYEGTLRGEFQNEDWNSTTPFGEGQADDLQENYEGTLGGFALKDRLWFFGGLRYRPDQTQANNTVFTGETFQTTNSQDRWSIKLRGAITANHIVEASHLDYESETTGRAGLPPGDLLFTNGVRSDPREIFTLGYQGVLTNSTFVDALYTDKDVEIISGGDPDGLHPVYWAPDFIFFNNHWWDATDPSIRSNETAAANLTQVFDLETFGQHTLEVGGQWVESTTGGDNRQSATGLNLIGVGADFVEMVNGEVRFNLGTAFRWDALELGGNQIIENNALYVNDTIHKGNWRFDVGLRWDDYSGEGPLPQQNLGFSDIAPRFGITYNITPDWQIQGTYGKYVSRFNDNIFQSATGVGAGPLIETFYTGEPMENLTRDELNAIVSDDANWLFITSVDDPAQPSTFLADDIEAPYADDYTLSLRRALPRNTGSFSLTYVNREFNGLIDDYVGTPCAQGQTNFDLGCPDGNYVTIFTPQGDALATVDTSVWDNNPNAVRDYRAITANFSLRPSPKWWIGGNYTYSETQGNYEGEGQNTPSSGSSLGDYPDAKPGVSTYAPYGYLDEDIPHRGKLWGSYRFDFGRAGSLVAGSVLNYRAGSRWSRTAPVDYTDVPQYLGDSGTYTHFFEERGANEFNSFWSLDLSARYDFRLWQDLNLWLKGFVFNVTNESEVIAFSTSASAQEIDGVLTWVPSGNCGPEDGPSQDCTGFGRIRSDADYQAPRSYLVHVGLSF